MRRITAKYSGECRACGESIAAGEQAVHEKHIGLFCVGCDPAEGTAEGREQLRQYRQEALDRREERDAERAAKRRAEAARLHKQDETLMRDHAFLTQPGHIPGRERVFKRREKAARLSAEADSIERGPRTARVKGDAAQRNEERREAVRQWIEPGMRVVHGIMGPATVEKVNRKTARVRLDSTGNSYAEDLMFMGKETTT